MEKDNVNDPMIEVYGVKGFDKNLCCRGFKFEVGHTYTHPVDAIKICNFGFHFSPNAFYASNYYKVAQSRFCLVKGLIPESKLPSWSQFDKYVTHHIEIIKEINNKDIISFIDDEIPIARSSFDIYTQDEIFHIKKLKTIQKAYPNFIVGGSVGLYLQGFNIKRNVPVADFDFTIPYYQYLSSHDFEPKDNVTEVTQMDEGKNSGNDFDYTNGININGSLILMDMKIDPKAKYIIVNYDGFNFKVCPWDVTIRAKMSYLNTSAGSKHKKDLLDMFHNPKHLNNVKIEKPKTKFEIFLEGYKNEKG